MEINGEWFKKISLVFILNHRSWSWSQTITFFHSLNSLILLTSFYYVALILSCYYLISYFIMWLSYYHTWLFAVYQVEYLPFYRWSFCWQVQQWLLGLVNMKKVFKVFSTFSSWIKTIKHVMTQLSIFHALEAFSLPSSSQSLWIREL